MKTLEYGVLPTSKTPHITAAGRTVTLRPGDLIHLQTRLPHAVKALEPSKLALFLLTGN